MNNLLQTFEKQQIDKLTAKKRIPAFRPGDTIKVTVKIVEGEKSRLQAYEGVCISRKNNSVNSKFTVRKMSHGEGVERVFPLFSPNIDKIEVIRKGNVKRAKLYYLRDRTGKSARIADRDRGNELDQYALTENLEAPAAEAPAAEAPAAEAPAAEAPAAEAAPAEAQAAEAPAAEAAPAEASAAEAPAAESLAKAPVEKKSESSVTKADNTENESK